MAGDAQQLTWQPDTDARGSAAAAARDVWIHLPAWMFLVYGCLLLNALLTNLNPPRPDLAFTAVFPITVFVAYFVVRALKTTSGPARTAMLLRTFALAIGLPTANYLVHTPNPLSLEALRLAYEISNFGWVALMLLHASLRRRSDIPLLFGAGLIYGAMLENGGILLGYFDELHLRAHLWPFVAPVSTMLGWSVVLYLSFFVVRAWREWIPSLHEAPIASAALVALVAVLLDLEIDPVATASKCWVWHAELPPILGDVPLVNFLAWISALFPFAWVVFRFQETRRLHDRDDWSASHLVAITVATPIILVLAALLFLVMIGLFEGVNGPSWMLLNHTFRPFGSWLLGV